MTLFFNHLASDGCGFQLLFGFVIPPFYSLVFFFEEEFSFSFKITF